MNCNVHVFFTIIFRNKFGVILERVFSYKTVNYSNLPTFHGNTVLRCCKPWQPLWNGSKLAWKKVL